VILARDDYSGQLCGAPAQHVDHIVPVVDGGNEHSEDLRALCAACNLRR
jgi:5-methylcytosine-specific restriction endonuclease McrA